MLDEQQIRNIIEAQGMKYYPRVQLSGKGDGVSKTYVRAYRYEQTDHGKMKIFVDLGRIEQVARMNAEELTETIKQKFAEKLRLKAAGLQQNQKNGQKSQGHRKIKYIWGIVCVENIEGHQISVPHINFN